MSDPVKDKCLYLITATLLFGASASADVRAFPGAEGFGAFSKGGRGGAVLYVRNLNDSGPGSLREAVQTRGPRMILFAVSGVINLESPLILQEPFVTIAGQSAPGDGICIKDYGLVIERTHDVIVRYMRFRPGDEKKIEQDALTVAWSSNVIIDHCSTSWGTDETLSVIGGGTTNVTVQWTFITESLDNSIHHKGPHGYGSLIRVDGNVSFHHNLFAHHSSRNPRPGCYGNMERGGMLDFRNNVIYNWGSRPGYNDTDKVSMNYVGNYLKPGPSTTKGAKETAFLVNSPTINMYFEGNVLEGSSRTDWQLVKFANRSWYSNVHLPVALQTEEVRTEGAIAAKDAILANAGAVLPVRDAIDARVVNDVRIGTGRIIDSQREVGGWLTYRDGDAPTDADEDGMPDDWEALYGFNPENASDAGEDRDDDGYTNVEEFLNTTNPLVRD